MSEVVYPVRLDRKTAGKLRRLADASGRTRANVVRVLIERARPEDLGVLAARRQQETMTSSAKHPND